MKIYTGKGDHGTTELFGGQKLPKHHLRIQAYGCIDELNSHLGLSLVSCEDQTLTDILTLLMNQLFDLGADLATPTKNANTNTNNSASTELSASITSGATSGGGGGGGRIDASHVTQLENWIDQITQSLEPMTQFILPGGCELAARLHVARTVCRRAETLYTKLAETEYVQQAVGVFINRLSDLLFILARKANQLAGVQDIAWQKNLK